MNNQKEQTILFAVLSALSILIEGAFNSILRKLPYNALNLFVKIDSIGGLGNY